MKIRHDNGGADYAQRRAVDYPALAEQMDALWHAMDRGEIHKVAAFYDPIAAVKARYPKPPTPAPSPTSI